ncbi:Uncharacterised protein [Streptococcus pneumoniae]|nr:Uncharacterised protein [Streptococcus pneumoniae]
MVFRFGVNNWGYKLIKTLNDEEIRLNIMEILEERIDDNVEKSSKDEIT